MELSTSRYRNLTVLVLAVVAQLVLLGYQVRSQEDVRLIRVWVVTAFTGVSGLFEGAARSVASVFNDYVLLVNAREENQRLSKELETLKLEAHHLRSQLAVAERAEALKVFQSNSPSRTVAARIIGAGTAADSKVVFIDAGTSNGVARGMAVITPDGVAGKVRAAYPSTAQVVLISDPSFAAGVLSQKNHVEGTLRGLGHNLCRVDYVQNEEELEVGEWFYTTGDDRVFPRGLPAGVVTSVRKGKVMKEIHLTPAAVKGSLEEVLVVLEGVHQPIPPTPQEPAQKVLLGPPPPQGDQVSGGAGRPADGLSTDADKLRERYRRVGEAQGHKFGEGAPGARAPNFNIEPSPSGTPSNGTPPPAGPANSPPRTGQPVQ